MLFKKAIVLVALGAILAIVAAACGAQPETVTVVETVVVVEEVEKEVIKEVEKEVVKEVVESMGLLDLEDCEEEEEKGTKDFHGGKRLLFAFLMRNPINDKCFVDDRILWMD